MNIIMMRHSEALSRRDAEVPYDADRPLSDLGRQHAARLGMFLTKNGLAPESVVCSPFVRTQECAGILCRNLLNEVTPLPLTILAPGCGSTDLLRAAQDYAQSAKRWMLAVLHEPDVSHILSKLIFHGEGCPLTVFQGDLFAMRVSCGYGKSNASLVMHYSPMMAEAAEHPLPCGDLK
jgi:phosphohistidine phosphatase